MGQPFTCLVVKERETGDQVVKSIKSRRDQVLRVMTEELQGGKHGKTTIPDEEVNKRENE